MTSPWARNYKDEKLDRDYYAKVDKEGKPMQLQIPQTYQVYTGTGGESITLDGSNRVIIDSTVSAGPLIISAAENYNLHGRVVHILFTRLTLSDITFTYPNGLIHLPGTASTTTSLVFAAGLLPTEIVADFYGLEDVFMVQQSSSPAPPLHLPAVLNYNVLQDAANVYDTELGANIQFDPAYTDSTNNSTVVWNAAEGVFDIVTDGMYFINLPSCLSGFLTRCVRISIGIQYGGGAFTGRTWGETTLGLTCQTLSLGWAGALSAGDKIAVFSVYAPGAGLPPTGGFGLMNGLNTQTEEARNFIQIMQL